MNVKSHWDNVRNSIPSSRLTLGKLSTFNLLSKTGHHLFSLARYKFAAKMIGERKETSILELGCSEGLGTMMLAQSGANVTAVDFDKPAVTWAKKNLKKENVRFLYANFLGKSFGTFDAVVSIDVIEHILQKDEKSYVETIAANLHRRGCCIVGTPNVTSQKYSSPQSREGHVNMFSAERLKRLFERHFHNVFSFGMNDEILHTGYSPLCHYLFVLACDPRERD